MSEIEYTTDEQIEAMRDELRKARLKSETSALIDKKNKIKKIIFFSAVIILVIIAVIIIR
ncbi:MAG: hypothetical protein A2Y15_06805 [Clostridiales bacterium GWF2_36_10]|nr:MAG: hypothetical protein A2Y15_06805 [Clostridiales bacterium GWF2_36_10]HAN20357.1 hypothetical protein [Clostridiales bacterium]